MSTSSHPSNWLPCSVVFISTAHEQQYDIMTATAMFVSEKEPLIAVSLSKNHRTLELIKNSGSFTVVIAVFFVALNLLVDISYTYLDPRVRLE